MRSVGVEEELLLVDVETGEPRAVSAAVLAVADRNTVTGQEPVFEAELQTQQLEFATSPQTRTAELADEILRCRAEAARCAGLSGAAVAALASSPLPVSPSLTPGSRYRWMAERFGPTVHDQLTCGCHIHVSVESDEEGVAVLDRIRPWLPVLLALSANSPFWQGQDSDYGSYRTQVWGRWPSAGPAEVFGSAERYHQQVRDMVGTGVLHDEGMIYYDARLSYRYPTIEVRVADVCLEPDSTVLLAVLVRALVETAARAWRAGEPPLGHGVSLMRLAAWQAARHGIEDRLLHPLTMRPEPAETVLRALFDHVAGTLREHGDHEIARTALTRLLKDGTGAAVQRAVLQRTGSLRDVVTECVRLTGEGLPRT